MLSGTTRDAYSCKSSVAGGVYAGCKVTGVGGMPRGGGRRVYRRHFCEFMAFFRVSLRHLSLGSASSCNFCTPPCGIHPSPYTSASLCLRVLPCFCEFMTILELFLWYPRCLRKFVALLRLSLWYVSLAAPIGTMPILLPLVPVEKKLSYRQRCFLWHHSIVNIPGTPPGDM
jgi:hypothetical protein